MEGPNPAQRLPPSMLPHVHLVSSYRWPVLPSLSIETVVEYLIQAPKITREVSAMAWTFLNSPPDGTLLLAWQPPQNPRGINRFAADGYIWGDTEKLFVQQYRGYNIEMYSHKIGYNPPNEVVATHARRRYRLTPLAPNLLPTDPSLWLVHYCRADNESHVPTNQIPVHPGIQALVHQRRALLQHGQLMRKEFMLYDRNNWPTIHLPGGMAPPQPGHGPHRIPQGNPAMMNEAVPSPAKRPRHSAAASHAGPSRGAAPPPAARDAVLEDEEDDKDTFDTLTPRDISAMRFAKHQAWMEETFSSAYNMMKILPADLGLELKGELAELSQGLFEALGSGTKDDGNSTTNPITPEVVAEFKKRCEAKMEKDKAEMAEMTRVHNKRMAEIKEGRYLIDAEKRLRSAATGPGPDKWRLEGGFQAPDDANNDASASSTPAPSAPPARQEFVEDIVREVEGKLGLRVIEVKPVTLVARGGLEEKAPPTPIADEQHENGQEDTEMVDGSGQHGVNVHNEFDQFSDIPDLPHDNVAGIEAVHDQEQNEHEQYNAQIIGPSTGNANGSDVPANGPSNTNDWAMGDKQQITNPGNAPSAAFTSAAEPSVNASTALAPPTTIAATSTPTETSAADDLYLGTDMIDFGADNSGPATSGGESHFAGADFEDTIDFGTLDTAGEGMDMYDGDDGQHLETGGGDGSADAAVGTGEGSKVNTPSLDNANAAAAEVTAPSSGPVHQPASAEPSVEQSTGSAATGSVVAGASIPSTGAMTTAITQAPTTGTSLAGVVGGVSSVLDVTPAINSGNADVGDAQQAGVMGMDLDDSAFGDAFHHTEAEADVTGASLEGAVTGIESGLGNTPVGSGGEQGHGLGNGNGQGNGHGLGQVGEKDA